MTNNKQQTAVEWLAEQMLWNEFHNPYLKQAKEMEKEQKMNDFIAGMEFIAVDPNRYKEDFDQYYEQTYGGGEQ
jgi:histidinol phosphatase-like PHP family hydrolase